MKNNNEQVYQAIKKSIVDDLQIAYEVFKEEEHEGLEGVILYLNSNKGFGEYLKSNPSKLADFSEHLFTSLEFVVHIGFGNDGEEELYPLIEK